MVLRTGDAGTAKAVSLGVRQRGGGMKLTCETTHTMSASAVASVMVIALASCDRRGTRGGV